MYGTGLKLLSAYRFEVGGEPTERHDIVLKDGRKNAILILKVDPTKIDLDPKISEDAAKWLGEMCERMSGHACQYNGVVIPDDGTYSLEVVEVEDPQI